MNNTKLLDQRGQYKRLFFLSAILVLATIAIYVIYHFRLPLPANPIRSDGIGYYIYLPAIFIEHDISLQTTAKTYFDGDIPEGFGVKIVKGTKNYLIKYPMGEALLMMPFFLLAYLISYVTSTGINGFSPLFQYAMALSGLFYATAGLFVLWDVLRKRFRENTILVVLTSLLFGTNLFHYATYDAVFSHVYSFFLFCLFLYLIERLYSTASVSNFLATGAVAGLIVITRPSNGIWLIFGILYGVTSLGDLKERFLFFKRCLAKYVLGIAAMLCVIALQLIYWRIVTGNFVVYSYQNEGFNFYHPEIMNVLFSVRKGIFFWSPILLTILPGLVFLKRSAPEFFVPSVLFLLLNVYIISSWTVWWYGGSFGSRVFLESLPIFAISLCSLYEGINNRTGKRVLVAFMVLCMLLSTWLMIKYWLRIIPFDGTTWSYFVDTFFVLTP